MIKRRIFTSPYVLTEGRIVAWTREGRGAGAGLAYRPWLTIRNVKSRGRKHRMRGILHDRVMHLMSDLERNAVLHFERLPSVVDIREQFPLDREVTRSIARAMAIRHPADPASKIDIVMTTDLLIDFVDASGRRVTRAFSIKPADEMLKPRIKEKQEIERRYWKRLGVRWKPMFDDILRDTDLFEALRWVRDWFYVDGVGGLSEIDWERRRRHVTDALAAARDVTLGEFTLATAVPGRLDADEVLSTLRHLAARRLIEFCPDLGVPTLSCPVGRFAAPSVRAVMAA